MKILVASLIFAGAALAQSPAAKDAITALRDLNAYAEAVMMKNPDMRNYASRIDAVNEKVERYLASPAKNDEQQRAKVKSALEAHIAVMKSAIPSMQEAGQIVLANPMLQECTGVPDLIQRAQKIKRRSASSVANFVGIEISVHPAVFWTCAAQLTPKSR